MGFAALFCCGLAMPAHADRDFDDLVNARYIHCAFFRNTGTMDAAPDERQADLLVHYQGIDREREHARMITTRSSGMREVRILRTPRAVHFVESAGGEFFMTTVFGCNERDRRRPGPQRCIAYAAASLRVYAAAVLSEPDRVFESVRHLASHGFCDHSFVGLH